MKGFVSLTRENNIAVEYGDFYVEMCGLIRLTDVFGIEDYDPSGYFLLDTNYGHEIYEVGEYLKDVFTFDEIEGIGFLRELARVKTFTMKKAYKIDLQEPPISDVKFNLKRQKGNAHTEDVEYAWVMDPDNKKYRMMFFRQNMSAWHLCLSTYPPTIRRYQAVQFFIDNVGDVNKEGKYTE